MTRFQVSPHQLKTSGVDNGWSEEATSVFQRGKERLYRSHNGHMESQLKATLLFQVHTESESGKQQDTLGLFRACL